jgi:hypothetical protein
MRRDLICGLNMRKYDVRSVVYTSENKHVQSYITCACLARDILSRCIFPLKLNEPSEYLMYVMLGFISNFSSMEFVILRLATIGGSKLCYLERII